MKSAEEKIGIANNFTDKKVIKTLWGVKNSEEYSDTIKWIITNKIPLVYLPEVHAKLFFNPKIQYLAVYGGRQGFKTMSYMQLALFISLLPGGDRSSAHYRKTGLEVVTAFNLMKLIMEWVGVAHFFESDKSSFTFKHKYIPNRYIRFLSIDTVDGTSASKKARGNKMKGINDPFNFLDEFDGVSPDIMNKIIPSMRKREVARHPLFDKYSQKHREDYLNYIPSPSVVNFKITATFNASKDVGDPMIDYIAGFKNSHTQCINLKDLSPKWKALNEIAMRMKADAEGNPFVSSEIWEGEGAPVFTALFRKKYLMPVKLQNPNFLVKTIGVDVNNSLEDGEILNRDGTIVKRNRSNITDETGIVAVGAYLKKVNGNILPFFHVFKDASGHIPDANQTFERILQLAIDYEISNVVFEANGSGKWAKGGFITFCEMRMTQSEFLQTEGLSSSWLTSKASKADRVQRIAAICNSGSISFAEDEDFSELSVQLQAHDSEGKYIPNHSATQIGNAAVYIRDKKGVVIKSPKSPDRVDALGYAIIEAHRLVFRSIMGMEDLVKKYTEEGEMVDIDKILERYRTDIKKNKTTITEYVDGWYN